MNPPDCSNKIELQSDCDIAKDAKGNLICKHCKKPVWGEGWNPSTEIRFYTHKTSVTMNETKLPPLDVTQEDQERAAMRAERGTDKFCLISHIACRDRQLTAALEREEKLKEALERIHNLTDFQECYGYKQRAEAAEAALAEMTTNRDQWERNSAAENKRAGDALVKLAALQAAAREYRDATSEGGSTLTTAQDEALRGLLEGK